MTLFGLSLEALEALAGELGIPAFRGRQIAGWLYGRGAESVDGMTNLPLDLRKLLAERYRLGIAAPLKVSVSADATRKYLFPTGDRGFVEAAFIPEPRRATLCLSVQVGCRRACRFCATGKQGLQGDLSSGEIVNQYRSLPERERVTNIVYMGMGEPMDNLENVLASLEVLTADWGFAISPRRITVSTVGVLPQLADFLVRKPCRLAVSLHTPFSDERRRLMPIEGSSPLADVLGLLRESRAARERRVSFEYIMFAGVNDDDRHARELIRILHGIPSRLNLIRFHEIPGVPLRGTAQPEIEAFRDRLRAGGLVTTVRRSRGRDIEAACGLLSTRELVRE